MDGPLYEQGPFWSSIHNTDTELNIYVSDKYFQIHLLTANFTDSPALQKEYLHYLQLLGAETDPESPYYEEALGCDALEDLHEWALKPFLPIFRDVPSLDKNRAYTVQHWLSAEKLDYTVMVSGGQLRPQKLDSRKGRFVGERFLDDQLVRTFSVYRPDQVRLALEDNPTCLPAQPRKVHVEGSTYFFKLIRFGNPKSVTRELHAYKHIRSAQFDHTVRTPHLHGVVRETETNHVLGLLLDYINCKDQSQTLYSLRGTPPLRQKWIDQVSHTLKCLHEHGIAWGDARPYNVLVDVHGDAYLVDFGGGHKQTSNSVQDDLQGLKRIAEYILAKPGPET